MKSDGSKTGSKGSQFIRHALHPEKKRETDPQKCRTRKKGI